MVYILIGVLFFVGFFFEHPIYFVIAILAFYALYQLNDLLDIYLKINEAKKHTSWLRYQNKKWRFKYENLDERPRIDIEYDQEVLPMIEAVRRGRLIAQEQERQEKEEEYKKNMAELKRLRETVGDFERKQTYLDISNKYAGQQKYNYKISVRDRTTWTETIISASSTYELYELADALYGEGNFKESAEKI